MSISLSHKYQHASQLLIMSKPHISLSIFLSSIVIFLGAISVPCPKCTHLVRRFERRIREVATTCLSSTCSRQKSPFSKMLMIWRKYVIQVHGILCDFMEICWHIYYPAEGYGIKYEGSFLEKSQSGCVQNFCHFVCLHYFWA